MDTEWCWSNGLDDVFVVHGGCAILIPDLASNLVFVLIFCNGIRVQVLLVFEWH